MATAALVVGLELLEPTLKQRETMALLVSRETEMLEFDPIFFKFLAVMEEVVLCMVTLEAFRA